MINKITIGDRVKDTISGYQGIAVACLTSLYEATQFRVHKETLKDDGTSFDSVWFEAGRLEVVAEHIQIGFKNVL